MLKWDRIKAGHYISDNKRFYIKLEDGTKDSWFLTDTQNPNALYGHWTLKGCKEKAETILQKENSCQK